MPGHVFVVRTDITKLKCDAWLLPGGEALDVTRSWLRSAPPAFAALFDDDDRYRSAPPPGWGHDGVRVLPVPRWHDASDAPQPYLVNVGGRAGLPIDWWIEGVRQFIARATEDLAERASTAPELPPERRRAKPLIALPLVGTGFGGAHDAAGEITRALLRLLRAEAADRDVDIVLVTFGKRSFTAAQAVRKQDLETRWSGDPTTQWRELDRRLGECARDLAAEARAGRLVIFLGAGVSASAGLPLWDEMLARLAAELRMSEREQDALARLDVMDRALILRRRFRDADVDLGCVLRRVLSAPYFSLEHALLAALPLSEVATMNYDTLFEDALAAIGMQPSVLPYRPDPSAPLWLLKLHGSVTEPDDIVLTREDYMRYESTRAALRGIVQALLITRRMLFVGFSLTDDNFHQIVDEVRRALGARANGQRRPFGTAIVPQPDPLLAELWSGDVETIHPPASEAGDVLRATRAVEIFLDYLLFEATDPEAHIFDDAFDAVLTPAQRRIRDGFRAFAGGLSADDRGSAAFAPFAELFDRLGGRRDSRR